MNFERRLMEVINEKFLGGTVEIIEVTKNNGVKRKGITVKTPYSNCSPVVYLDKALDDYNSGKSITEIAQEIYSILKDNSKPSFELDLSFDNVKENICFKLINAEKNKELLEDVPHRRIVGDLVVIYEIAISREASITIKNSLMDLYAIKEEMLWNMSQRNTPRLFPYKLKNLMEEITGFAEGNMYVLTKENNTHHGAVCILYPELLKDFATALGSDMYIIPSSIDEVIIIPKKEQDDISVAEEIKEIIGIVNQTEVSEDMFLSDFLFEYNRKTGELIVAA